MKTVEDISLLLSPPLKAWLYAPQGTQLCIWGLSLDACHLCSVLYCPRSPSAIYAVSSAAHAVPYLVPPGPASSLPLEALLPALSAKVDAAAGGSMVWGFELLDNCSRSGPDGKLLLGLKRASKCPSLTGVLARPPEAQILAGI